MHKVKIAIIDNGIDETFLKKPLEHRVFITDEGKCASDKSSMKQVNFKHGSTCAMIIEKYLPECSLSSVMVLNETGTGMLTSLKPAFEWCLDHGIKIINLSLGTTHFKDRELMRSLINEYAAKGLIFIAAASNSGYASYPAAFSNVIGVAADNNEYVDFSSSRYQGIDVLAPAEYGRSNSYAAPYVTALVGKLCPEKNLQSIGEVKRAIRSPGLDYGIQILSGYGEPDWIHTAVVRAAEVKSSAKYFFDVVQEPASEKEKNRADTIILADYSEIEEVYKDKIYLEKHIILLGDGREERCTDRFFWSPQIRFKQIFEDMEGEREPELGIPIILLEWEKEIDEMYLLTELKKNFFKEGYHLYAASLHAESVLYDLDYIPEDAIEKKSTVPVLQFINKQTHYKQCDAVILGMQSKLVQETVWLEEKVDLKVKLKWRKKDFQVIFTYEDCLKESILIKEIDIESITAVFLKMEEILTR